MLPDSIRTGEQGAEKEQQIDIPWGQRREDRQIAKCRQLQSVLPEEVLGSPDEINTQKSLQRHSDVTLFEGLAIWKMYKALNHMFTYN